MRKLLISISSAFLLAASLTACAGSEKAVEVTAAQITEAAAETTTEEQTQKAAESESVETEMETKADESQETAELPDMDQIVTEPMTLTLGVPKAPPTLAILHMIEDGLLGENVDVQMDIWDAPEKLLAMVQDGKHDMFAFPLTVAAKLYNKGVPIVLTNVNTWGVTYFMTSDPEFKDLSQLKGKTVYVPLQSSPPDVLTQFLLAEAGLKPGEDVEIVYTTTAEVAQLLVNGTAVYATLIEPQCTAAMVQNKDVHVAFSFEDEYRRIKGEDHTVPNAGFGTTKALLERNPEFVSAFETIYETSLNWVLENPEEAAKLAEKYLELKAPVVQKAIPNMGLMYQNSLDAKPDLDDYYQLLQDFDASMIGGKVPDEGMYYQK